MATLPPKGRAWPPAATDTPPLPDDAAADDKSVEPAARGRVSPFRPFRSRGFAILWSGALVSTIGSWIETVAVGVYVTQVTGKAGWTGTVAALAFLPSVLFSPLGGALADRFERRRFLAVVIVVESLLAAALAVLALTGHLSVAAVALILFLEGSTVPFYVPAFQSMLPDIVPREDLVGAMSLSWTQFNLGRVVGPAIAGLILTVGGFGLAFGLNALSFMAVLIALAFLTLPPSKGAAAPERILAGIASGFRVAAQDRGIRTALLLLLTTALLVSPFISLIPAVAIKVFGHGAGATSTLVTAQGLGAVSAALCIGPLAARVGRRRVLVAAFFLVGPVAAAYGLSPTFPVAVGALFVLGFVYLTVLTGVGTVLQLRAPAHARARVLSLNMLTLGAGYPLGSVVQGWVGDQVGLRVVTASTGVALLAVVLLVSLLRPGALLAMDDPEAATTAR